MTVIPQYGGLKVANAALPNARVDNTAPAASFGVPANVDLSGVAQVVQRHVQEQQDAADNAVITNKEVEISNLRTALLTHATSALGVNAIPASEDVTQQWNQGVGKIMATLTNDRQKKLIAQRVQGYWANLHEAVETHVGAQLKKQAASDVDALLHAELDTVVHDPTQAPRVIEKAKARLTDYGRLHAGWTPEELQRQIASRVSTIHATAISQFTNDDSPQSTAMAKAYFDAHGAEMIGKQFTTARDQVDEAVGQNAGQEAADKILGINQPVITPADQLEQQASQGMITKGNIDIKNRPRVKNADGSVSTVRTISIEEDGKTILIPTVVGDKVVSNADAIAHYRSTGENLGVFDTQHNATVYAKALHEQQAQSLQEGVATSRVEALARAEAIKDPKSRKAATAAILAHFRDLESLQHMDRQDALVSLTQQMEASGGKINRGSAAYQSILGHPEEQLLLHHQKELLHPPKDPGDPDLFMSKVLLSNMSPATQQEFLRETPKDWSGMNVTQQMHLATVQSQLRAASNRQLLAAAAADVLHYKRAYESAITKGDQVAATDALSRHHDAQTRLDQLHGVKELDPSTIPFTDHSGTVQPQQGSAQTGDVDLSSTGLAGHLSAVPVIHPTRQMIEEAAQSPGYAAFLRKSGVQLPATLPPPKVAP